MSFRHGSRPRPNDRRGAGSNSFDRKDIRKVQQLCRQVHRALMYVIPGELADPLLQELLVEAVRPAPDASRLLVILTTARSADEAEQILARLEQVRARLRAEAAAAICRKRAPELAFQLAFGPEVNP